METETSRTGKPLQYMACSYRDLNVRCITAYTKSFNFADNSRPQSAKLPFANEITGQSRSFNELNRVPRGNTHLPLTKSKSWSCTPCLCDGIPLGSLTAQAAAKPFWGKEMLQERIQEIAEYAALETSSLGSSIEDNLSTTVEDLEERDIPSFAISDEASRDVVSKSAPVTPRQQSPVVLHSQSAQFTENSTKHMEKSRTRKSLSHAMDTRTVKSATARLTRSATDLSIEGKRMQLSPRNPIRDDGFHE